MIKTVGASAIIKYKNKYIFEIQKSHKWHRSSEGVLNIGIGCIGGSIEENETPIEALKREVLEEISTNIDLVEWNQTFTVNSNLNVFNTESEVEDNLFFEWYGTKKPYRKCRVCVFLGEVRNTPFPGDLPGLLVTDIDLLIECVEMELSLKQCLHKGMEIIAKEEIPIESRIKGVGTVKTLKELYKNHKTRLKHLL